MATLGRIANQFLRQSIETAFTQQSSLTYARIVFSVLVNSLRIRDLLAKRLFLEGAIWRLKRQEGIDVKISISAAFKLYSNKRL